MVDLVVVDAIVEEVVVVAMVVVIITIEPGTAIAVDVETVVVAFD